jgi:hypothetical protein
VSYLILVSDFSLERQETELGVDASPDRRAHLRSLNVRVQYVRSYAAACCRIDDLLSREDGSLPFGAYLSPNYVLIGRLLLTILVLWPTVLLLSTTLSILYSPTVLSRRPSSAALSVLPSQDLLEDGCARYIRIFLIRENLLLL